MQCPHCRITIHPQPYDIPIGVDADGGWLLRRIHCPACSRWVLSLVNGDPNYAPNRQLIDLIFDRRTTLVRPKAHSRPPCPAEVPVDLRHDYEEACLVLADSAKASAALSRRCLQHLLRTAAGVKPGDLAAEIQQVLDSSTLPSLSGRVDRCSP